MPSTITGAVRRRPSRTSVFATAALGLALFGSAATAQAAKTSVYFDVSAYPADFAWDGIGTPPVNASTGNYYVDYYVRSYDGAQDVSYRTQQLRGGAVIRGGGDSGDSGPVAVLPGDVFRAVRRDDGATLAEATFTGQPAITSSVIGQPTFAGTSGPGATDLSVELYRRVARNNTSSYGPPRPPQPSNAFETVSFGRLTAIGDTTFGGSFSSPIVAGDYITATQSTSTIASDVSSTVRLSITSPAGVVPARDAVPPVVRVAVGAKSLNVGQFLKTGLNTFVTVDEPATIKQTLSTKSTKKSKSKKKASKALAPKKKPKKTKKPAVVKVPAPLAEATGATKVAGETTSLTLKANKKGKKILGAAAKKGTKLTLTTTATDAAGNVTTTTQTVKLAGTTK